MNIDWCQAWRTGCVQAYTLSSTGEKVTGVKLVGKGGVLCRNICAIIGYFTKMVLDRIKGLSER